MPVVSVVIPLYQTERYIAEAIGSVLAQTFTDFELIVVDDGSRDRGPEIARGYAARDKRVRVVTQENRGLAGARNTGIRHAKGEFIALLDADDRWLADKLARHVALMTEDPAIGLSFCASRLIDDDGEPTGLVQHPARLAPRPEHVFCRNPVGNGSAPVIRRGALKAIAFTDPVLGRECWFDESFRQSEDIECWLRIATTGLWRLAGTAEILTEYRVNTTGLSANVTQQFASWCRFRTKVKGYAPALERTWGDLAEAYQLRYLARRAVRSGDATTAIRLMRDALAKDYRIATQEPGRTFVTAVAALARAAIPDAAFHRMVRTVARG